MKNNTKRSTVWLIRERTQRFAWTVLQIGISGTPEVHAFGFFEHLALHVFLRAANHHRVDYTVRIEFHSEDAAAENESEQEHHAELHDE